MCGRHPLWSHERANAVSFRRRDYLGDPSMPLDRSVRDLVEQRTGRRPDGPISLLTQVRTWGWLFNPISVYYCFAPDGETVDAIVVEVTNTPWHERTTYVLPVIRHPSGGQAAPCVTLPPHGPPPPVRHR